MAERPWIKLYVSMLSHPGIGQLSDGAFRAWIALLLMAGKTNDGGRAGTVEDLAWHLRRSKAKASALLEELGDRIQVNDDEAITVSDWLDWQPPSTSAERQAAYRERKRRAKQQPKRKVDTTEGDEDSNVTRSSPSRHRHVLEKNKNRREEEESREAPTSGASPKRAQRGDAASAWEAVLATLATHLPAAKQLFGGARPVELRDNELVVRLPTPSQYELATGDRLRRKLDSLSLDHTLTFQPPA